MKQRHQYLKSVAEYAELKSVTPQAIRKAIRQGRLDAYVIGKSFVIDTRNIWEPRQYINTSD